VTPHECTRGHDVVSRIVSGRWGANTGDPLHDHVRTCDACAELAALATLFAEEREVVGRDAPLPAAGQVWWRSAIRGRLEDQRAAERPLVWLYAAAIAVGVSLTAAVARVLVPALARAAGQLGAAGEELAVWRWTTSLTEAAQPSMPFVLGIGAAAVLVLFLPLLYVALSDD